MEFTVGGQLVVRITPSDVGKRVSVRSLTGPDEPDVTFTDTVGVLTSWQDGVVGVTRRDGRIVRLAEADLVAGKVVPPAPPLRRGVPAADVAELTAVAARGWPGEETGQVGDWLARAGGGGWTRRANSAVRSGPADPDTGALTAWYAARGLPLVLQLTTDGPGSTGADALLAARLDALGWAASGHTVTMVAPLAALADRAPDPRVRVERAPSDAWLAAYSRTRENPAGARRVLAGGPSVLFASAPADGNSPAAVGRCAVDGRWAGLGAIEVGAAHRRRGLATALVGELARAALAEGASAAYLQVETDNAPAHALYGRLGFTAHSHYHYRTAPREG
ncbi:GNAT family N-acetyltransferase [Streptomyces sp. NPDC049881]|uniref:GNAT family N-acetyltransferase n=1 Tax=Streptomyces sp. NPDC049881 TaxID=3155778 RepID=UPI00343A84E1